MFGWHLRELGNKPICESGHAGCFHYFPSVVLDFRVRGRLPRDRLLGQQPSASRTQRERKTLRLQTYTYTYIHIARCMLGNQSCVLVYVGWCVCACDARGARPERNRGAHGAALVQRAWQFCPGPGNRHQQPPPADIDYSRTTAAAAAA